MSNLTSNEELELELLESIENPEDWAKERIEELKAKQTSEPESEEDSDNDDCPCLTCWINKKLSKMGLKDKGIMNAIVKYNATLYKEGQFFDLGEFFAKEEYIDNSLNVLLKYSESLEDTDSKELDVTQKELMKIITSINIRMALEISKNLTRTRNLEVFMGLLDVSLTECALVMALEIRDLGYSFKKALRTSSSVMSEFMKHFKTDLLYIVSNSGLSDEAPIKVKPSFESWMNRNNSLEDLLKNIAGVVIL